MGVPSYSAIFEPPVNRSMTVLDRSFFQRTVSVSAFTIFDNKQIADIRKKLKSSGDELEALRLRTMREASDGRKYVLLHPGIKADNPHTWSPTISKLIEDGLGSLEPYDLMIKYDDWTTHEILEAALPEFPEEEKETPSGFAVVGHVAHVNLRAPYHPYRHLIGQVLIDKNPAITTVINKTEDVGAESVFRTFPYEVIAGPPDLDVEVAESDCFFRFNFGKVYWNSRLNTEHKRLISKFQEGEAVCDVMAGVGPFAVPAGQKRAFVWANDLNPECFGGLEWAIRKNKVDRFVTASCVDGREFIRTATCNLKDKRRRVEVPKKKLKTLSRTATMAEKEKRQQEEMENSTVLHEPATFDHYVMNLPATAVEFLDAFLGVYAGRRAEFEPHTPTKLPMIHVYLFTPKEDTEEAEQDGICEKLSGYLCADFKRDMHDLELWDVRLVSPKKKMYCASFRLPAEVAFAASAPIQS